jgi:hypothetical protein
MGVLLPLSSFQKAKCGRDEETDGVSFMAGVDKKTVFSFRKRRFFWRMKLSLRCGADSRFLAKTDNLL